MRSVNINRATTRTLHDERASPATLRATRTTPKHTKNQCEEGAQDGTEPTPPGVILHPDAPPRGKEATASAAEPRDEPQGLNMSPPLLGSKECPLVFHRDARKK